VEGSVRLGSIAAGAGREFGPRILLGLSATLAIVYCTDQISPVNMTHTAIDETFARINIYARTDGAVPTSLDALPKGYVIRTVDGWGRPLQYRVQQDGIITVTSYGRDGVPGGIDDDADISVSYRTRYSDGNLWVGADRWIVEARVR
jgi:hypothetical protein